MSVTILNTKPYEDHVAQLAAAVELAVAQGWVEPEGQSAGMDNMVTSSPDADVSAAPAPKDPGFTPN